MARLTDRGRRKRRELGERRRKTWRVRFGKYAGKKLAQVPKDYLRWLASAHISERLLGALIAEFHARRVPVPRGIWRARRKTSKAVKPHADGSFGRVRKRKKKKWGERRAGERRSRVFTVDNNKGHC